MNSMTSRKRVLTALDHKEPDRVPVDLGGTTVTGISAIAYHHLKNFLGIKTGYTRVIDVLQQLARVEDPIIDKFQLDVLDLSYGFNHADADWYDITIKGIPMQFPKWFHPRQNADGSYDLIHKNGTVLSTMAKSASCFWQVHYPFLEGFPEDLSGLFDAIKRRALLPPSPL